MKYDEFLTELNNGLKSFPGDIKILDDAMFVVDRQLKDGNLPQARQILEICLSNSKDSPLLASIRQKLDFTDAWIAARRAADLQNYQAAGQALTGHTLVGREFSLELRQDLRKWETAAANQMNLEALKVLLSVHGEISPDEIKILQSSFVGQQEKIRENETRAERDQLKRDYAAFVSQLEKIKNSPSAQERISALQNLHQLVDLKFLAIAEDDKNNRADFGKLSEQIKASIDSETRQLAKKEIEAEAERLKSAANALVNKPDQLLEDLKLAAEKYDQAGKKFESINNLVEANRLYKEADHIRNMVANESRINEMVMVARNSLTGVNENKWKLPEAMLNVIFVRAMLDVALVNKKFPSAVNVIKLVQEARQISVGLGWTDERFAQALALPAVIDAGKEPPTIESLLKSNTDQSTSQTLKSLNAKASQTASDVQTINKFVESRTSWEARIFNISIFSLILINSILIGLMVLNILPFKANSGNTQASTPAVIAPTVDSAAIQAEIETKYRAEYDKKLAELKLTEDALPTAIFSGVENGVKATLTAMASAEAPTEAPTNAVTPPPSAPTDAVTPPPAADIYTPAKIISDSYGFGEPGNTTSEVNISLIAKTEALVFPEYYNKDIGLGLGAFCRIQITSGDYKNWQIYTLCTNISTWDKNNIPAKYQSKLFTDAYLIKRFVLAIPPIELNSDFTAAPTTLYQGDQYTLFPIKITHGDKTYCRIYINKSPSAKVNQNQLFYALCADLEVDPANFIDASSLP